jgi:hypothetical protein
VVEIQKASHLWWFASDLFSNVKQGHADNQKLDLLPMEQLNDNLLAPAAWISCNTWRRSLTMEKDQQFCFTPHRPIPSFFHSDLTQLKEWQPHFSWAVNFIY